MVTRYNRGYLQTRDAVEEEFPYHKVLMILEKDNDNLGRLIATSSNGDSFVELCNIMEEYPAHTYFFIGGFYKDCMSVGVIDFV